MATLYEEAVELPATTYGGVYPGNFRPLKHETWISCRVSFHQTWHNQSLHNKLKGFFYTYKKTYYNPNLSQTKEMVVKAITMVEDKLGLSEADRCKIWPVKDNSDYLFIEPSDWWVDPVRCTFLSILLRDARDGTLEQIVDSGYYFQMTKAATRRFLEGNTFYHGESFGGWIFQFGEATVSYFHMHGIASSPINHDPQGNLLQNKPPNRDTIVVTHHPGWTEYTIPLVKR